MYLHLSVAIFLPAWEASCNSKHLIFSKPTWCGRGRGVLTRHFEKIIHITSTFSALSTKRYASTSLIHPTWKQSSASRCRWEHHKLSFQSGWGLFALFGLRLQCWQGSEKGHKMNHSSRSQSMRAQQTVQQLNSLLSSRSLPILLNGPTITLHYGDCWRPKKYIRWMGWNPDLVS